MITRITLFILFIAASHSSYAVDSTQTSQDTSEFSTAKLIEIMGNNLLVYDTPVIEDEKNMALNAIQSYYLHAHGQKHYTVDGQVKEVNYVGTFGLGPCIGLGLITQVEGEDIPYITVAHFDALTRVDDSVEKLLEEHHRHANPYQTRAVLIQGKASDVSLKQLFTLYQYLQHRNIPVKFDVGVLPFKNLIINLKTGEVLHPSHFCEHDFSWLSVKFFTFVRLMGKRVFSCFKSKELIKQQFDLINNNVPSNYVQWYR